MSFETILLLALLAPTCAAVAWRARAWRLRPLAVVTVCAGFCGAVTFGWRLANPDEKQPFKGGVARENPQRPTAEPSKGYVTSENCRRCHPSHHATWHASYHRTMTTVPSENSIKGDFEDTTFDYEGEHYRMTRDEEGFWVEMDDPDWLEGGGLGERTRVRRKIELITGSHHLQFYWSATGRTREMRMLPIVYNLHDQRWVPFPATLIRPPGLPNAHEPGAWNEVCIQCHVTHAQPKVMGASEMYSEAAEFGISCEACHGPAEKHIEVNADMLERYRRRLAGEADASVVEPTKLASKVDSQVCGQCHSVNRAASRAIWDNYLRQGFSYRPGGQVEPERVFARLSYTNYIEQVLKADPTYVRDHFWPDGMVRVAGREYTGLIESPCYQHDDDERRLSCFSCHEMHQADSDPRPLTEWANDQLKHKVMGDQACLQCHEEYSENVSAHTHHAAASSGSRCYNCHMPHTTYGLLKGIRSHQVSSPSAQETLEAGRPNACNLCHLDQTLEWTAKHLNERHGMVEPKLDAEQRGIAASLLWLIKGDAAQRALTAWHYGWESAQEASGTDWMPPFLTLALDDEYPAVRYIASKALWSLSDYEQWIYDYVGPAEDRLQARGRAMEIWRGSAGAAEGAQRLLLEGNGNLDEEAVRLLLLKRDNTPINMAE